MPEFHPLIEAARTNDLDGVRRILQDDPGAAGAVGEHRMTALHLAAESDHAEIAGALLDAGADAEALSDWNATPLDWAATLGATQAAAVLLERGADGLDLANAAGLGRTDDVRRLLVAADLNRRRGAPDQPDDHWPEDCAHLLGDVVSDAFYSACRNGHVDTALLLLEHGARLDARGVFGGTGLHWAAVNGHGAMVDFLLEKGASRDLEDRRFASTPAGWAREGGHPDLAARLER